MNRSILITTCLLLSVQSLMQAEEPALKFAPAEVVPELEVLFQQPGEFAKPSGWTGGDGVYSVPVDDTRCLWLFSDTWVGIIRDGHRKPTTMVNNTVGVQRGRGPDAEVRLVIQQGTEQDKPNGDFQAIVKPADGLGWYWLQAGVYHSGKLYMLLAQMDKTGENSVFGFKQIGQSLGVVANPDDDPTQWKIEQHKLPFVVLNESRQLSFGTAMFEQDKFLYVYGVDDHHEPGGIDRGLVAARVPLDQITDFAAWRFYSNGEWVENSHDVTGLIDGMANEGSVSYLPDLKQYVLVYTEAGLSPNILARTGPSPVGPWSDAATIYKCPETARDKRTFCYSAKAHPFLAEGNELVVSYVANSFELAHVVEDATLYFPRFVRVRVSER